MQGFKDAQEFVHATAKVQRVIQQSANRVLRVDEEDGADRRCITHGFVHHAEGLCDFLIEVSDHRELNLNFEIIFYVPHPRDVRVNAVHSHPNRLHVEALEIGVAARELNELSSANRREVRRMREQHDPLAFRGVIGQADHAVRRLGMDLRSGLVNTRDPGNSRLCAHKSPYVSAENEKPTWSCRVGSEIVREVPGQQFERMLGRQQMRGRTGTLILMVRFPTIVA